MSSNFFPFVLSSSKDSEWVFQHPARSHTAVREVIGVAKAQLMLSLPSIPDQPEWASWPDEKLLDVRLCDLDLAMEGGSLHEHIQQLYTELDLK